MNPLLEIRFRIPFDEIRAEHVQPAIDQLLADSRDRQAALASSSGPRTFDSTLLALDEMTDKLDYAMSVVRHLESVATYPELRAAYNAVQPAVSEYYSRVILDPGLWKVLKDYASTTEAGSLTGERRRFFKKTLDAFRRNGADLDEAGKARLAEIDVELASLTTKFAENVLDATNAFELVLTDEHRLAGLPPSAREAARESAKSKGLEGWRFTLQAPSYTALMTYLDDRAVREQMYFAYNTRATSEPYDNRPLMARIVKLRRAKAELLGFSNFADLVLEDRMARRGDQARKFVEDLWGRTRDRFEQENRELQEYRTKLEGTAAQPIQPWDVAYYAEKLRSARYDFDEEELRPYFPLEQVIAGLFAVVEKLYGVRVIEEQNVPVWDPEVKFYWLFDSDNTRIGAFYADWFPRENKRGGAWMDAFITGRPTENSFEPHLGLVCGNLTPPVGDKPALLTHREVETIFHEFGHLLHHCLSRVNIRGIAGTNVSWDFVELPSQIMENWCWERESLDLFAQHYETGATIPEDLYSKMKQARTFRSANAQMRQLGFGLTDLTLHTTYTEETDGDVLTLSREILKHFSAAPLPEQYGMLAAFTHLFSSPVGYAAGYYSYKWAEVLEADAFTRFLTDGIFSRVVGMDFRDKVLSRGDSDDPSELYRAFMGRDPDVNALLKRSGLA